MKYLNLFIILLIYGGCTKQENLTCSSLENEYNRYHYLKENHEFIPINTIKGQANRDISRQVLLYDLKEKFKDNVSKYMRSISYDYTLGQNRILKPYLNKYCYQMNFIMKHDTNQTRVRGKFEKLEKEWVKDYENNLKKDLENSLQFHEFIGCEENTRKWSHSFISFSSTPSAKREEDFNMFRQGYKDCLRGSIKKYKLQKDKEKKDAK